MAITLELGERIVAAVHERARSCGLRGAIAAIDEGGDLQGLNRIDGTPALSAQIADTKAAGAALRNKDGGELVELERVRPSFFGAVSRPARLPILPALGAVPRDGNAVRGGRRRQRRDIGVGPRLCPPCPRGRGRLLSVRDGSGK